MDYALLLVSMINYTYLYLTFVSFFYDIMVNTSAEVSPRENTTHPSATFDVFNGKSSKVATCIINHPCKIICTLLMCCILMSIYVRIIFAFPEDDPRTWFKNDDILVHRLDALALSIEDIENSGKLKKAKPKSQMADKLTTAVIFKTKDGSNILQPSNPSNNDYLSYITNINFKIYSSPYSEYYNLCYADSDSFPDCSSAAIFDPISTAFGDDPNNVTHHDIDQWIAATTNVYGTQFYSVCIIIRNFGTQRK
eukprot:339999_1